MVQPDKKACPIEVKEGAKSLKKIKVRKDQPGIENIEDIGIEIEYIENTPSAQQVEEISPAAPDDDEQPSS